MTGIRCNDNPKQLIRIVSIFTSKAGFCVLLYFLLPVVITAQNLVPNAGFEDFTRCPGSHSQHPTEFRALQWTSATAGTPDLFNRCSVGEANVPHNWAGVSEAYEGGGYAGIYCWTNYLNYREYLQCRLATPLVKDSTYLVEFHFRLSSYSMYAVDRIGLLFQDSVVNVKTDKVLRKKPDIMKIQDSVLTVNTGLWEVVKQAYKARGNEQYLVIGNFDEDQATKFYRLQFIPVQQEMLKSAAYYYIDNVIVEPKYSAEKLMLAEIAPELDLDAFMVNRSYILRNVNFEFNSYKLSYASTETLDELAAWMMKHQALSLVLAGHTDDIGSDQYNLSLSRNRARTVAEYLIAKGIDKSRITHSGFGKRKPLIDATTEQARNINRRVEVRFLE
jgi:OmpA-OmpF porin, OOP family